MYEKKVRHKRTVKINLRESNATKANKISAKTGNLFAKISSLKIRGMLIATVILFAAVFTGIYVADNFESLFKSPIQIDAEYFLLGGNRMQNISVSVPSPLQVRDKENPINGVLMTSSDYDDLIKRHPVAVTMNNHTSARPQHGLSKADVVLEVLAEGGITRYVPIYYQNYWVSKIGPVRSLRYYMIMFTSEYADAIILHEGQAGYDNASWETYREKADARGAIYNFGIKNIQSAASRYRDLEKAYRSGYVHSLYTDFSLIRPEIANYQSSYGWELGSEDLEPLKFKYDASLEERGSFKQVEIEFLGLNTSDYSSSFKYDKTNNVYKRFIAGVPDIDQVTSKQIAPKNVIIEWHNYGDANDGHGRLIIDMIGDDKVTVLRDGRVINGRWKKECRTCRTKYYDSNGDAIELVRGQIWIVNVVKVGDRLVSTVKLKENQPSTADETESN